MWLLKFKTLIVTFIIISICILSGLFWFFQSNSSNISKNSTIKKQAQELIQDETKNWSTQVNNKFISAEWSKEDYILNNLAYIIDNKDKQLEPEKTVDNINQTLLMSNIYLQNGKDQSVKNKIKDFHTIIYPFNTELNNIQINKQNAKKTIGLFDSILDPIKVNAQMTGEFEYTDFIASELENTIYTRPEHRIEPEFIELLKTALTESYIKYQELGYELKPADIVVYLDEFRLTRGSVQASASVLENKCRINIWGSMYNEFRTATNIDDKNKLKQVIAHEIYHCVQNVAFPESFAAYSPFNFWFIEGGAEYFANVVYPNINLEDGYNNEFDRLSINNEIYKISYPSYIFHQYLANKIGNDGLKTFYSTMPVEATWSAQRQVLSGLTNIEELFHNFAKEYFDNTITDTSGSIKNFNPIFREVDNITGTTEKTYRSKPFVLRRLVQEYNPRNGNFTINVDSESGVAGSYATKVIGTNEWKPMPTNIPNAASAPSIGEGSRASCSSNSNVSRLKFIQTSTQNVDSEHIQIINITANNITQNGTAANIDRGILGTWQVDAESLRRISESLVNRVGNSSTIINSYVHNSSMCFKPDGTFFGDFASNIEYTTTFGGGGPALSSSIVIFGTFGANYTTENNIVSFTNLNYNDYGRITTAGISLPIGNKVSLPDKITAINAALDTINSARNQDIREIEQAKISLKEILSSLPQSQPAVDYSTPYQLNDNAIQMKFPVLTNPDVILTKI